MILFIDYLEKDQSIATVMLPNSGICRRNGDKIFPNLEDSALQPRQNTAAQVDENDSKNTGVTLQIAYVLTVCTRIRSSDVYLKKCLHKKKFNSMKM